MFVTTTSVLLGISLSSVSSVARALHPSHILSVIISTIQVCEFSNFYFICKTWRNPAIWNYDPLWVKYHVVGWLWNVTSTWKGKSASLKFNGVFLFINSSPTPWRKIILQDLTFIHLVKFLYEAQRYITMFTRPTSLDHVMNELNPVNSLTYCFFSSEFKILSSASGFPTNI